LTTSLAVFGHPLTCLLILKMPLKPTLTRKAFGAGWKAKIGESKKYLEQSALLESHNW
jgi:hypothetical protein